MPYKNPNSIEAKAARRRAQIKHNQWIREHPKENAERCLRTYYKFKDKINQGRKKLRDKLKTEIIELLGGKCVKCGYIGVALQIDHVNGGGCKERRQLGVYRYYKKILKEIKSGSREYQLLCANHNWEKKFERGEV